jgi:hypothetical protein
MFRPTEVTDHPCSFDIHPNDAISESDEVKMFGVDWRYLLRDLELVNDRCKLAKDLESLLMILQLSSDKIS